jgi:phosphoacetylglucosamine mutase
MQDDLDVAMHSVTNGRCFVRPSGTEDVVRIYAEAATQEEANELSKLTREAINKHLC